VNVDIFPLQQDARDSIDRILNYRPLKDPNLVDEFHHQLISWINDFHRSLDENHEVGAQLVSFGQTVRFHIENIGHWNPSLISFYGKNEDGNPAYIPNQLTTHSFETKQL